MKLNIIGVPFVILLMLLSCSTTPPSVFIDTFETRYRTFRYSLYSELQDVSLEQLESFMLDGSAAGMRVYEKAELFFKTNRQDILVYREALMAKYSGTTLDLTKTRPVDRNDLPEELFNRDLWPLIRDELGNTPAYAPEENYLWEVLFINPYEYLFFCISLLHIKQFSLDGYASWTLLNRIGSPLIKTEQLSDTLWKVYFDEYGLVYVLEYNLPDNGYMLVQLLERS